MKNKLALFLEQKLFLQNNDFSSTNFFYAEIINKIKYYCEFLDSLEVNTVMIYSSPSLEMLCLCHALVLKNKTYIPIHTSTAPELLISYLSTFSVDLLIIEEELVKSFDSEFKDKLHKEQLSDFFYYRSNHLKPNFCWLPGIVFFTSGTTELPKAVHYRYEVIQRYLHWGIQEFTLTQGDHFLFNTELSFVASLRPLFIPLLAGAKISFIKTQANKINFILNELIENKITILNMTPTLFKIVIEHIEHNNAQNQLIGVRLILLSGEPLDDKAVNYWLTYVNPNTIFYNLYGATEFLVPFYKKITKIITEKERFHLEKLRPGCDYRLKVTKEKGYEIYIAGDIATGYFDTKQTKKSYFLIDNKLFIKTNDFVKIIQKQLYYHTRSHRLIKLYGQIINLDQLEYLLRKNYPVHQFTCIINDQKENEIHLFVKKNQKDKDLLSTIKVTLKQHLPNYMHPSHYHFVEDFPKTQSGKIDYLALNKIVCIPRKNDLNQYFKKFFPDQDIDNNTLIQNLGLESIDYIELSLFFLKKTGKWFDSSRINAHTKIKDLYSYLTPMNFKDTKIKHAVKLHWLSEAYFIQQKREIYLVSSFCLDKKVDLDKLELAIAQTIDQHFMLSCKLVNIKDEYFFEKTESQTNFWLKTPLLFKKYRSKLSVFTYSERLVYIYLQKKNKQNFLIIAFNHIALDGWSALLIREELFRNYEGYKESKLPKNEEIKALNKINEIWLPTNNSLYEFEKELLKINPIEYNQVRHLFDIDLVPRNSCFLITKEKTDQYISNNKLINIPYSVLFALILNQAIQQLINNKKLMFYVSFSNRNLPI